MCLAAQARLWVQLMRELRHGVKLRKVQQQEFNPLPTEFQLTPFEMLMQDIRARNYKLRKVMVSWAHAPPPSRLGSASLACARASGAASGPQGGGRGGAGAGHGASPERSHRHVLASPSESSMCKFILFLR